MRVLLALIFSLPFYTVLLAQTGNEWINYNQQYFKIPVGKDGLYKLTFSDLQSAGFPVGSVNAKNIQLYHRGREQAILVNGEQDNLFDPADNIVFYGRKNDGTLDAELYKPASSQPHKYYNLYNDTTSYFLTVGAFPGKRIGNFSELNTGTLIKENFHLDEKLLVITNQYGFGVDVGDVYQTFFDSGEGWMGSQIGSGYSISYTLKNISQSVTSASPLPQLEMLLVGRISREHQAEIYVGGRLLTTVNFTGFNTYKLTSSLEWSDITAETLTVGMKVIGIGGQPDAVSVAYCKLLYPQGFNAPIANEKLYNIPVAPAGKAYIEIQSPPSGLTLWDITDPENALQIEATLTGTLNAVLPATETRKLWASNVMLTPKIKAVSFRQINPAQHNYIIITHPLLRRPAAGYSDPVEAYAAYRASDAGGNYDTLILNIQQIYDQFNYGEKSPLGIFHLMRFYTNIKLPSYLFIIGKGIDVWFGYYRNPLSYDYQDLVPTAGYPGSDMAFTIGLAGTTYEPAVPTGRISASKPQQVADYLKKIMEMEALPFDALWRKDFLHLSGGIKPGEPQLFKSYMQDFQATAEGDYLGAKVTPLAKNTTEIQPINISTEVNKGLNMITFFGHSAPTAMDFEIGYASHPVNGFNNKGKYPFLLVNGCEAGAAFLNTTVFGEDWVLTPDKGSIGFISHTAFGFVSQLRKYSETFYNVAFADSIFISKGVGDVQKETARRFMETSFVQPMATTQVQQMVLLGDPAYRLFGATKPDLEINDKNVYLESLDGKQVTTFSDSFAIKMIVRNFGQSKNSTVRIVVNRTLSDNSILSYDSLYSVTRYMDTLTFIIRNHREQTAGNNTFHITIDPEGTLQEITKENNVATLKAQFILNGTKNLFPSPFAIVKDKNLTLSFQTNDLLSEEREFLVEFDTTNTFDSPYKQEFVARGIVLAKQSISLLTVNDTLAYYWRTKLADPLPDENKEWTTSSFTFINQGPEGWAQVHFPQFLNNQIDGILADSSLRKFSFEKKITTVSVRTYGSQFVPTPETSLSIKIDNFEYNYSNDGYDCRSNSINLIAFNRKTGAPYIGLFFEWFENFGRACGRQPFIVNNFQADQLITGNGDDIIAYVDKIEEGDSVLIYTIGDPGFSTWPAAAKLKFLELGVSIQQLETYPQGTPLIVFGRKGSSAGSEHVYSPSASPSNQQMLEVSRTITSRRSFGEMQSSVIGPAQSWQSFEAHLSELMDSDVVDFTITGISISGDEEILFPSVTSFQDLNSISAESFPYLKIKYNVSDDINLTATQVDKWLVLYTPAPEGLLLYKGPLEQSVLQEGDQWIGNYAYTNISDKSFTDSLTIKFEAFTKESRTSEFLQFKIPAPAPGDTTDFQVTLNTIGKSGLNDLRANVNPGILPELYYDNNSIDLLDHLFVEGEALNPVLQVSIDGRQIQNGDVVSPNPVIKIKLWDGNDYIFKTDTLGMRIFLTYPCDEDCVAKQIPLSGTDIVVHPASANTDFQIDYNPRELPEGLYVLQVEASDVKGNESGAEPYRITFEVKHDRVVTLLPPYPNPSEYEVYFPIEITGDLLPEGVDISITHVNGQVIAHFSKDSFQDLHSGKNILTWNATDASGNPLPNGIYVYKETITLNEQQTTQYGKVVLLR